MKKLKAALLWTITWSILAGTSSTPAKAQSNVPSAPHSIDPVFAKLKPYRTYYQIDAINPYAHQFTAIFMDKEQHIVTVRGRTVDEIKSLKRLPGLFGSLAPLHLKPVAAPAQFQDIEAAARAKILELHPDATGLVMAYEGQIRQIFVSETIPLTPTNVTPFRRIVRSANVTFAQKLGMPGLKLDPGALQSNGEQLLCRDFQPDSCTKRPYFLPFLSAADAEGRSPLAYYLNRTSQNPMNKVDFPEMNRELDRLWRIIVKTAGEIDARTYKNPIDDILARQTGDLPANLKVFLVNGIQCAAAKTNADSDRAEDFHAIGFGFTMDQLRSGFTMNGVINNLNLKTTLRVTGDKFSMVVAKPTGESIEFAWTIKQDNISANGSIAPNNGEVHMTVIPTGNDEATWKILPGDAIYSKYRCWAHDNLMFVDQAGVKIGPSVD